MNARSTSGLALTMRILLTWVLSIPMLSMDVVALLR